MSPRGGGLGGAAVDRWDRLYLLKALCFLHNPDLNDLRRFFRTSAFGLCADLAHGAHHGVSAGLAVRPGHLGHGRGNFAGHFRTTCFSQAPCGIVLELERHGSRIFSARPTPILAGNGRGQPFPFTFRAGFVEGAPFHQRAIYHNAPHFSGRGCLYHSQSYGWVRPSNTGERKRWWKEVRVDIRRDSRLSSNDSPAHSEREGYEVPRPLSIGSGFRCHKHPGAISGTSVLFFVPLLPPRECWDT